MKYNNKLFLLRINMKKTKFTILSIEDNLADFHLLQKAFSEVPDIKADLINIADGKTAVDFLYKKGKYKDAKTPDIIILDLNLPSLNGKEILKIVKNDKNLKVIPVIMFSTSDAERDIEESYKLYASSYITKTFDINKLFQKIATMAEYWLKTNEFTRNSAFCFVKNKKENV
jgi:DNA-binding response OmpR family regulator